MTRRLHRCITCEPNSDKSNPFTPLRGYTRHDNGVCAACRSEGITASDGQVNLPISLNPFDSELRTADHYPGRGGW